MLPSQRTLQLMAAIDDGDSNIAWLEAPLGNTAVACLVFDVLGHLCLWGGCDMRLPPSLRSPAAIGGMTYQWRKQQLGNRRSPRTRLAADLASDNRAGGLRLCWQVPSLVVRAGQTLAVCSGERCSDRGTGRTSAPTDGMAGSRRAGATNTWMAPFGSDGLAAKASHFVACLSLLHVWGGEPFGPISPDMTDQSGTRTLSMA